MRKQRASHEVLKKSWASHEQYMDKQVRKKKWTSHELVMNKLWSSCKQVIIYSLKDVNILWTSRAQVMNKDWTNCKQVFSNLWTSHEQVMNKTWTTSHEKEVNKSSFFRVLTQPMAIVRHQIKVHQYLHQNP